MEVKEINEKEVFRYDGDFKLPTPIPEGTLVAYKVDPSFLRSGFNIIDTFGGKGTMIWMEIYMI